MFRCPAPSAAARRASRTRGGISVQMLVLLVPVFFGLMGFAVDLGRLYMVRGELRTAAEAMALAAASRLIMTEASTADATDAARRLVETDTGFGNRYDFGGLPIGESSGFLTSEVPDPIYYGTAAEATGEGDAPAGAAVSGEVTGAQARHVRVEVVADAPLVFWRFLSLAQEGKVPIRARAAAGLSAPVCTACGIEPIAIAALDPSDTTNYGFTTNTRYTLGYVCNGNPVPQPLPGAVQRLPYLILNRLNDQASVFAEETQQLFRAGAQGLVPSTNEALACFRAGSTEEQIWATASPLGCAANTVQTSVRGLLCGLATRLDNSLVQGCAAVNEVEALTALYTPDTDFTDLEDYSGYTGNTRRILTVVIVEALAPTATMTVLGFRQFLLQPNQNATSINPNDPNGRFTASYLGGPMPLKQGRFGSCGAVAGPGKVVLHR